jgi:DNA-binding FrmR family transcriptional regulator
VQPSEDLAAMTRGYGASRDQVLKRLARAEGQVRGVTRMVEEDRYCIDILTQISAAQAALDKIALGLLDAHARHCMQGKGEAPEDPDEQVAELMGAVGRLVHR